MRKTFILLFALIVSFGAVQAQTTSIEKSESFDEPNDGWNKLMQLKNGNTVFFHFSKKEGIEVTIYDKNRKQISSKTLESDMWEAKKMKVSQIEGLYEIKGQPVIFLQQIQDHTPILYRIVIDPQTGAKIKEDKIGELLQYKAFAGYALLFGGTDPNNSFVEKDPASDNYAVVYFNGFAHETNARIEVVHYDGDHKEINRAFFASPGGKFKYLRFIGLTVDGDRNLYLCTYGFNTGADKESRIIVSRLRKGEKEFASNMLDFSEDFKDTKAVMHYNPSTKLLQILSITVTQKKAQFMRGLSTYYLSLMTYIDPETLKAVAVKPLEGKMVSADLIKNAGKEEAYSGVPQDMIINNDNTTTVLMEEMRLEQVYSNNMSQIGKGKVNTGTMLVSEKTILDNIGVEELDQKGEELHGYGITKSQVASGYIPNLYLAQKGKGYWSYGNAPIGHVVHGGFSFAGGNTNAFMSFDYVNTDKARYILFNDAPKNIEKDATDKRTAVQAVSNTHTMCYKLDNGKVTRSYLFGEPKDDNTNSFSYIEASNYQKETKTYATIVVERVKRDKETRIVWVKFE